MSTALFTVPVVGVLTWLVLIALSLWRHQVVVAERRQHAQQFRNRVLKDAERLDATLIEQLLDTARPEEILREYCTQRAALVPGLALETPAAWQNDDLNELVAQRFQDDVTHERRRLWVFIVVSLAAALATVFIIGAVLYHFHREADSPVIPFPGFSPALADPPSSAASDLSIPTPVLNSPLVNPLQPPTPPDLPAPPSIPAPSPQIKEGSDTSGESADQPPESPHSHPRDEPIL